jgi:hypothetical protein
VRLSIHLLPFKKADPPAECWESRAADQIARRDYHSFSRGRRRSGRLDVNKMAHFGVPNPINIS